MNAYGKAWVAIATAAATALYAALGDDRITAQEWVQISIAAATAIGVYAVPLDPRYRWGKTAVAVILAVLQALTTAVLGGVERGEWVVLLLAALTAIGVASAPAVSTNGVSSVSPRRPDTGPPPAM